MPNGINFGGMSPEQMLNAGTLASQLMGQQTARMRTEADIQNQRIAQKMELVNQALSQKMEEKKLALQTRRAEAYERLTRAQAGQAQASAAKTRAEMEALEKQQAFMENAQATMVDTTIGQIPLGTAMYISQAGAPSGFEIVDQEWKNVGSYTDKDGKNRQILLQPSTGKTREQVGVETFESQEPAGGAGGGDMAQWESATGQLKDLEKSVYKAFGASDFAGLDPNAQQTVLDTLLVGQAIYGASPDKLGTVAGRQAAATTKKYETTLKNIPKNKNKAKARIKSALRLMRNIGTNMQKAGMDMTQLQNTRFTKEHLMQTLIDAGFSESEANTILGQAFMEIRNAK